MPFFFLPVSQPASPPCFYWKSCRRLAALEKQGKVVCRACAERLKGVPYPLRVPTREPLYSTGSAAAEALDMVERHSEPTSGPAEQRRHMPSD